MSSAPLGCGLLAVPVSNSIYPANISHPELFQLVFSYSLIRFIVVCICLFSAAVPWTGGAGDAAVLESRAEHGASEHSHCSASRAVAVTAGKIQIPLRGSSPGVFALQMCTGTRQARGLPEFGGYKPCSPVRSHSGWCGGFCLLVQ